GHRITRMTDVADIVPQAGVNAGAPWDVDGQINMGFHNGYSRYSNVNITGEYMLAYRSNNLCSLYRVADQQYLGPVVPNANHTLGESNEIRWDLSGEPGTETRIYYHIGGKFYYQDAVLGHASQVL